MLLPALSGAWKGLKDLKDFHTLMIWAATKLSLLTQPGTRVFFFARD